MPYVSVVSSGVDSLYVSARGKLVDGLLDWLGRMREMCCEEATPFAFDESEGYFLFRPHGWRRYAYWLSSPRFELMIGNSDPFPPVFIQLHAAFLHAVGAEVALGEAAVVLSKHLMPDGHQLSASRIDVYADTQGWEPTSRDFERFVCRGVRRRMYTNSEQQLHGFGQRVSGFTFGKLDVVARVYDKTLELATRGETWPSLFWRDADPMRRVWRVEFQFRRNALVSMRLRTPESAVEMRQSLWRYGTEWLSLRVPTGARKRSRWPEDPVWSCLREAEIGLPASELVRERIRGADERRLVSGFVGYASSLAALTDAGDVRSALDRAEPLAARYLLERGSSFSEVVKRKRAHRRATRLSGA